MAIEHFCGKYGGVVLGSVVSGLGTEILGCYNWSISESVDTPEVTDFQSNYCKEYIACNKDFNGSFDVYFDENQCPTDVNLDVGETVDAMFFFDKSGAHAGHLSASVIINGITMGASQDEPVPYNVTFVAGGCLDKTNMCK